MHFNNRKIAIEQTLKIESITSYVIKHIFGLSITDETKSLDNKSSALSLKSKTDLLLDCGKIDKKTYVAIIQIMSIRNQFAHNYDCNEFEDLETYIDGIENFLQKYSNNSSKTKEENLKQSFLNLSKYVLDKLKEEFEQIIKDYEKNKAKLEQKRKRFRRKIYESYRITGTKNRRVFGKKYDEILDDVKRLNLSEEENSKMIILMLESFIKENPYLQDENHR